MFFLKNPNFEHEKESLEVLKMKFDLSIINMSRRDITRGVKLPNELDVGLAEFMGVMVGDGNLGLFIKKTKKGTKYPKSHIRISGNKKEEDYLMYVNNLFYSLFHVHMDYVQDTSPNSVVLRAHSKAILEFLNKICGIPVNRKSDDVKIPLIIKEANNGIKCAFLRGLADTDFTLTFQNKTGKGHTYPIIKAAFKSKNIVMDLENFFKNLGFRCSTYYDDTRYDKRFAPSIMHNIYLYGKENLKKWLKEINFSNPKFHQKVKKWKNDGICPPKD